MTVEAHPPLATVPARPQQRLKQADLDTLELAAQEGQIDLLYLDEAQACYSYSRIGQQKRLEPVPTRGSRISILDLSEI